MPGRHWQEAAIPPRLALSIGAVFSVLAGLPALLTPDLFLELAGITSPGAFAAVPVRDTGTLLIGVGIIDWLARDAVGSPLRGLLWGNLLIRVGAMTVNTWEFAPGQLLGVSAVTLAGLLAVSLALAVMFTLALRQA